VCLIFVDTHRGHREEWNAFMATCIKLPLCYLDSVCKVIEEGRWRAKLDPLTFIRKTAQSAIFGSLSNEQRNRTRAYVGRAIDPMPKSSPGPMRVLMRDGKQVVEPKVVLRTRTEAQDAALLFSPPKRRPQLYAGNIGDLKLPRPVLDEAESGRLDAARIHDDAVDYFQHKYSDWDYPTQRPIAPDVLDNQDESDLDEFAPQKVDWNRVADKAHLDSGERQVLRWKRNGVSRETAMAAQRTQKEKRAIQAAWRRLDRKWSKVIEAVRIDPSNAYAKAAPATTPPNAFIPPAETLRRLQEKNLRDAKNSATAFKASSLPVYTDYER
jgi:hypothetical protein